MDWNSAGDKNSPPVQDEPPLSRKSTETLVMNGSSVGAYAAFGPGELAPRGYPCEIEELIRLIRSATTSVSAQVMNYSLARRRGAPWRELDDELRNAGKRGVTVRLIFADWTMKPKNIADIKALARAANVHVKISTIPQLSSGHMAFARVEHCKYAVIDKKISVVSTSNWEYDYFYSSRDAAVILTGEKPAQVLGAIFDAAWNGPYAKPVEQTGGQAETLEKEGS